MCGWLRSHNPCALGSGSSYIQATPRWANVGGVEIDGVAASAMGAGTTRIGARVAQSDRDAC
jgi:hypothetical protein